MPQLDPLIQAIHQHEAEALVLDRDKRPYLLIQGAERAIVKSPLPAAHVSRLTAEIAPTELRERITAGSALGFDYTLEGRAFAVEVAAGPRVVIRPAPSAVPRASTPPAAELKAAPRPAAAPVAAAPATTPAPSPATPAAAPAVEAALAESGSGMDALLRRLVERRGSDLHMSSGCRPMIRVDGELTEFDATVLAVAETEQLLLSVAPTRNRQEFRETGDTDFAYEIEGLCRFRCNLFKDRKGSGGVFRVIPSKILTCDDLGLSPAVRELCFLTKGLVLVTGPTGSGKSTTLATMVDHVNRNRKDHIVTIEDPIEFVHPNQSCLVNQREVHMHTQSFKRALRAALREDPDVVLVGELRDLETVAIAIETAETGHLVFGTLHTSSAVSTIDRIIDQFPADQQEQIRIMLSESLKAVIAQVLCRKIGGGRVAALEVLMTNAAISNLIRENKTFQIPSIMQTAKAQGNVLLNAALFELVKKKLVEPEEAYAKAADKTNLLSAFEKANISTAFLSREDKARVLQPA